MTRVLIVDDSQTVLTFLQVLLESQQYQVITASDAEAGLAKILQARPDLIITDSIMPGVDGFTFLRSLRDDPATAALPVIMLTSGDPQDPEYVDRQPRPDALVRKSPDPGPLLAEMRQALARRA